MAKTLFTIKPHSIIDVITNSSSELFVGKSQNKDEMISLVEEAYPEYKREYEELKKTSELSPSELYTYLSYHHNSWSNAQQRVLANTIEGFSQSEMYVLDGSWPYIKDNFVSDNMDKIIKAIDPDDEMYFLFSLDENPNWEMQQELSRFMTRYHLG